jgi:hypothetical protein
MTQITLSLPEPLYQHAAHISAVTHIDISSVVTEALALTLPTFDAVMAAAIPLNPPDHKTVQIVPSMPLVAAQKRLLDNEAGLSELLFQQRESEVTLDEMAQLLSMILMHQSGWFSFAMWDKAQISAAAGVDTPQLLEM